MTNVGSIDPGTVGALKVAPSVLAADFGSLADAVERVRPEADWLHVDVMDGHFVPNISLGPPVVASLRHHSDLFFDCHLMITDPVTYLAPFAEAGAQSVTVHVEVGGVPEAIAEARALGLRIGIAANPDTPFEKIAPYLGLVDLVLCMTVFPGFGGQSFIGEVMPKVAKVRRAIESDGLAVDLEVDGGIDVATTPVATHAGANVLVAGSAIFRAPDPAAAALAIRAAAEHPVAALDGN